MMLATMARPVGRSAAGAAQGAVSAALTGTAASGWTEAEVVAGGETIVITLTNDTWVASGGTFDGQRQNILNGVVSAQSETHGFNAERSNLSVSNVVRTSNTVVTITLGALSGYAVTANEALTVTPPGTALTGGNAVVATPTLTITAGTSESVYFAMDYSSGAEDDGGWEVGANDASTGELLITRQAGIGPSGEDGYRFTHVEVFDITGGEFGYGWHTTFPSAAPFAYGDTVYFRFAYRLGSGANGRFYAQSDSGDLQECRTKFMILNQGATSSTSRPILTFNVEYNGGSPRSRWYLSKGGGDDPGFTPYIAVDTDWHYIQMAIDYSSGFGNADGGYRLWLDNSVEGSPDVEVTGITMYADSNPGSVDWGAYQNNGIQEDGVHVVDHILFAITESFTAGWA